MKETIIDLKLDMGLTGEIVAYLYELANRCEEKDAVIDADGLRHIALNIVKEVFKRA